MKEILSQSPHRGIVLSDWKDGCDRQHVLCLNPLIEESSFRTAPLFFRQITPTCNPPCATPCVAPLLITPPVRTRRATPRPIRQNSPRQASPPVPTERTPFRALGPQCPKPGVVAQLIRPCTPRPASPPRGRLTRSAPDRSHTAALLGALCCCSACPMVVCNAPCRGTGARASVRRRGGCGKRRSAQGNVGGNIGAENPAGAALPPSRRNRSVRHAPEPTAANADSRRLSITHPSR
jgi:hypothetical protein